MGFFDFWRSEVSKDTNKLESVMRKFCKRFTLLIPQFPYMLIKETDVRLYNFLFAPAGGIMPPLDAFLSTIKNANIASRRGMLIEYLRVPRHESVAVIERSRYEALKIAIDMCNKNLLNLSETELIKRYNIKGIGYESAIDLAKHTKIAAQRISHFHKKGEAIKLFNDFKDLCGRYVNKIPILEGSRDFDLFIHESIHFVLIKNGIDANSSEFGEGLCTYLHKRFRSFMGGLWYINSKYLPFAKYFESILNRIPDKRVGPYLKGNLRQILASRRWM